MCGPTPRDRAQALPRVLDLTAFAVAMDRLGRALPSTADERATFNANHYSL
jgi:hypothetical protein